MFSKFFIDRPRFAMVIACVLMLAGGMGALSLPIKQYPDVAPPAIRIQADYPGADAETMANAVAAPLEEAINGVDDMIYMSSTSSNNGSYSLTVTFKTGTDTDMALVKVQNRVQQAMPLLPTEVTQRGITTESTFSDTLGFVALVSPKGTHDKLYLNDYINSNVLNRLKRVPGMGNVQSFGAKYGIRIWLDPEAMSANGLSTADVKAAIAGQNKQASVGSIGARPGNENSPLVYSLTAVGRLSSVKQFENIVMKTTADGRIIKLKDVARIDLGAEQYALDAGMEGMPTAMLMLAQSSDSNAIDVMDATKAAIAELSANLPSDMEFIMGYDATEYVRETIKEIISTLVLTFSLVVFVCYLFLQDWRCTLVPVAAIPISLIATFIGFVVLGFSINILTLFGLVLVIGTVVDDAIIVVERVMFIMDRDKVGSRDATIQAMKDITGPMTATTLVFLAIFVPVAFMGGMTGVIYRQFAVTVSFSVVFSLIVALTLSPAMCANMLQDVKPKARGPLAWFNKAVIRATSGYVKGSMWIARRTVITIGLFLLVVAASLIITNRTPSSFIPEEDQGATFATVQLPEGASGSRTKAVLDNITSQLKEVPGVKFIMEIEGFSLLGDQGENVGTIIVPLEHWADRKTPETSQGSIVAAFRKIAAGVPEASINVFTPPPISGLGIAGGLDIRLQSTQDNDPVKLAGVLGDFLGKANQAPEFMYAFSSYTTDTPHMFLDIDRDKAEMLGVSVSGVLDTLQMYFGTSYINDINIGTQVNKVIVASDWEYRNRIDSIGNIQAASSNGGFVPLQSFMSVKKTLAPRAISRYNMFPSAGVTAVSNMGVSSGLGMDRVREIGKSLPAGYRFEWSGMTYQEEEASGQVAFIIGIAVIFGYLFLVAQYESWTVPLGVILSLPVALLGALIGVLVMKINLSIYTQLGILLLVGLSAKNAILIIEFAKEQHDDHGLSIPDAAAEAGRERFRSVMMTALTCVIGVLPMLFASGAGAASRLHVGTTMFFGMSIATGLGIFLIPGLYVVLQTNREKAKAAISRMFSLKQEVAQDEK